MDKINLVEYGACLIFLHSVDNPPRCLHFTSKAKLEYAHTSTFRMRVVKASGYTRSIAEDLFNRTWAEEDWESIMRRSVIIKGGI